MKYLVVIAGMLSSSVVNSQPLYQMTPDGKVLCAVDGKFLPWDAHLRLVNPAVDDVAKTCGKEYTVSPQELVRLRPDIVR